MTDRAHNREIYKSKQRLPAPEVPKSKAKKEYKPKKIFYLQHRYTEESWKSEKNSLESMLFRKIYKGRDNEWITDGKYRTYEMAEYVMEQFKRKYPWYHEKHEFQIIEKEK